MYLEQVLVAAFNNVENPAEWRDSVVEMTDGSYAISLSRNGEIWWEPIPPAVVLNTLRLAVEAARANK